MERHNSKYYIKVGDHEQDSFLDKIANQSAVDKNYLISKRWQIAAVSVTFINLMILLTLCVAGVMAALYINEVKQDPDLKRIFKALNSTEPFLTFSCFYMFVICNCKIIPNLYEIFVLHPQILYYLCMLK